MLDDAGYVPRLVLWDTNDPTDERTLLYAAPAWRVAEQELGTGRVPEVEIWHLRSAQQFVIPAGRAEAALSTVGQIVHRLAT
ncbi:MAG: hypothetical protein JST08_03255 [Actinobacteria bacterium]|nr:hypothetical protein [Actinomycetota bacterium]